MKNGDLMLAEVSVVGMSQPGCAGDFRGAGPVRADPDEALTCLAAKALQYLPQ